jgi:hypothetical protein
MTIKANGHSALISALILAAGLLVCLAGPSQAATAADDAAASSKSETAAPVAPIKQGSHHWKKVAHHKSGNVAKAADDAYNSTASTVIAGSGIPPSVANANAQLPSADTPSGDAKAMSARASTILQAAPDHSADTSSAADTEVVSADQLNDVDRALHEHSAPEPTLAIASAEAPAVATRNDSSTWDHTSLIGKIFIGFGALLTMASAARMFMA